MSTSSATRSSRPSSASSERTRRQTRRAESLFVTANPALLSLPLHELEAHVEACGYAAMHARALRRVLLSGVPPEESPRLPPRLVEAIGARVAWLSQSVEQHPAADGSTKHLVRLQDGGTVETVHLPGARRVSAWSRARWVRDGLPPRFGARPRRAEPRSARTARADVHLVAVAGAAPRLHGRRRTTQNSETSERSTCCATRPRLARETSF